MIIGLGHRSGHGKDLSGSYMIDFLRENTNLRVTKLSWAWKLKDICYQLYSHVGLRETDFYDTDEGRALRNIKLPKIELSPVEIWVKMGTNGVREQVWDRTWIEWVCAQQEKYDIIICPDTRFHNEIELCDHTVKITNPRVPNREGISVDEVLADYDGWNYYLINDGDKVKLKESSISIIQDIIHYV